MLQALIDSHGRFLSSLQPLGYEEDKVEWLLVFNSGKKSTELIAWGKEKGSRPFPKPPGDRTAGKTSPTLFVDDASYVIGLANKEKKKPEATAKEEQEQYRKLHGEAVRRLWPTLRTTVDGRSILKALLFLAKGRQNALGNKSVKPKDRIALRIGESLWPTDNVHIQRFWAQYLERRLSHDKQEACVLCGHDRYSLRILPFRVRLFRQNCTLSAVNLGAFESHGKEQLANAPICFQCAGKATQVLQYLLAPAMDLHHVVIARDESKGAGGQPLRNQMAVFWTKDAISVQKTAQNVITFDGLATGEQSDGQPLEELIGSLAREDEPSGTLAQLRDLARLPWTMQNRTALQLNRNTFHLGIISPNKSRLVVREWVEESIERVWESICGYIEAASIVHPSGKGIWPPPLPAMVKALRSIRSSARENDERPTRGSISPDMIRRLVRTAYTGAPPPADLLVLAVQAFRVSDPPATGEQRERQESRRMALASAMKLVLTHGNKEEAIGMQELDPRHQTSPYLCGQLLAILEDIQLRAAKWKLNTTIVDRFYGSASTAPASVFGILLNMAAKAHIPKAKKEGRLSADREELLCEVAKAIDTAGGFKTTLKLREQAEFALGFYAQRANFMKDRPKHK